MALDQSRAEEPRRREREQAMRTNRILKSVVALGIAAATSLSLVDGTGVTRLTNNNVADDEPVVSPDGTKVLFERKSPSTGHFDLWTMNTDGTGASMLFDCNDSKQCLGPDWSPDGTKITYARWNW